MPPKTEIISPPLASVSLQIRKHFRAESNLEIITDRTNVLESISDDTENHPLDKEVILDTNATQENEQLEPQTYQDQDFAMKSLNPPGAVLYQSGWEYGQLLKEFRCD